MENKTLRAHITRATIGTFGPIQETRFSGLTYQRQIDCWRFMVDGQNVGPQYRTKAELLADLNRYAELYGY
jgi:hypothetical protein